MPRKLTFIILTLLFPGYLYAFTLDTQGTQAGSVSGNFANQRYNSKDKFHDNVKAPMTDPNTPVTTLDGKQQGSAAPICGGDINNAKQVIQVTYTVGYPTTDNNGVQSYTASITVQTATATPGVLDSTVSAALDKVCQAGYMYQGTYYQWEVFQNGTINISPHVAPVGCVFPESTPLTYVGGQLSKRYADITGRPIVSSDTTATTITYYTGDVQDCTGKKKDLSQTRYYDNPYQMQSDAQTYGLTCTDPNDPTCSSYAGVQSSVITRTQTGVPQIVTCNITRTIGKNTAPENAIICTASRLYYAPGYSDTNKWCQPQTRWDYTSQLIIRCDPNGRSMTAEGWASWEGAPCGTQADFPPDNQIIYNLPYATFTDTVIGQFSVNKRNGGSNTAYNDRGDTSCYSDTNPLKVHATSTCAADMSSCQYVFTVDNAPNCSPFTITVTPPIAEHINDPCQIYEQNYTCKIQNETWYDAGNNTTAVIAIGAPTHNTVQTTCQTFPVGIVCHDWWQKKRQYLCQAPSNTQNPSINRSQQVATSSNMSGAQITYTAQECTGTNCQINTWQGSDSSGQNCEISCLVSFAAGASQQGNSSLNYEARPCDQQTDPDTQAVTYTCPVVSGENLIQDCGCLDTSGQALSVLGVVDAATKDRTCVK